MTQKSETKQRPQRIRLSRKKGFDLKELSRKLNGLDAVKVDRSTRWGNPYKIGDEYFNVFTETIGINTIEHVLGCYKHWLKIKLELDPNYLKPLYGKNIACWCAPDARCHADIILQFIGEIQ